MVMLFPDGVSGGTEPNANGNLRFHRIFLIRQNIASIFRSLIKQSNIDQ